MLYNIFAQYYGLWSNAALPRYHDCIAWLILKECTAISLLSMMALCLMFYFLAIMMMMPVMMMITMKVIVTILIIIIIITAAATPTSTPKQLWQQQ